MSMRFRNVSQVNLPQLSFTRPPKRARTEDLQGNDIRTTAIVRQRSLTTQHVLLA